MTHALLLHGPHDNAIAVNVAHISSLRAPRVSEHFGPGVQCVVIMQNGKFNAVVESCPMIVHRIKAP